MNKTVIPAAQTVSKPKVPVTKTPPGAVKVDNSKSAAKPNTPHRHKTGTKPTFKYPCTLIIEKGQSPRKDKGMVKRAICKENGEDYTRTIPYVTLRGAFTAGCNLRKDSADSKWYRISKVDGKPVEKRVRQKQAAKVKPVAKAPKK